MAISVKVAFIGLGVMGYPMAGHLRTKGHNVTVYNRTAAKARAWCEEHGGSSASTPAEACAEAEFVFSCVGNDDDLRSVVLGDQGIFAGMKSGMVLVDHTTCSADVAREMNVEAKNIGVHFMDAPVSGGQAGAENGVLTIMVGGDETVFGRARPVMEAFGKSIILMGDVGSGQLTKMVNQICISGIVQGLSEGLNFAVRAGLDAKRVVEVISGGAAQSWQMDNRASTMIKGEYDFGFAVDWMRKDLGICLDEANRNGARLPLTALVDQFYKEVQARDGNRFDTSSLLMLLADPPRK